MMKRAIFAMGLTLMFAATGWGQQYFTREGKISFYSETPMEKIEAHNSKASSVWDAATGKMEFAVLIKGFQFEKALMQEHFNENYMESGKFPKAAFKGAIADAGKVNLKADGVYPVVVKGDLTIHGVTKAVEAKGKITVKGGAVSAVSTFEVAPEDYGIAIPAVVKDNIAKIVRIEVNINYQLLQSENGK
jgi:hypothetical protein